MLYFWPRFCCNKNAECKMVESKKMWKKKDEVEEEQDDLLRGSVSGHQRADHPKAYMRQNQGFPALLSVKTLVVRVTELAWEIWYALLVSNNETERAVHFFSTETLFPTLQESRAHRIKAKLLLFWEWMGDLRWFEKPKTFQTKYFLWRILIWLLSNTTWIAGCQALKTSLAGRLKEAISQVNLN